MKAIIVGTFDPFTIGHRDIAERTLKIFGNVTVAVAEDTGKAPAPIETRLEIARRSMRDLDGAVVESYSGLTSEYLKSMDERVVLVRGIRNSRDMEYERDHARIYKSLCGAEVVCLLTAAEYQHISSTVVRQLARLHSPLDEYVVESAKELISKVYADREEQK